MNGFKKSLKHIHHLSVHNSHTLISQRDSPRKLLETQVFSHRKPALTPPNGFFP